MDARASDDSVGKRAQEPERAVPASTPRPSPARTRLGAGAEPHLNTCFKHYMYFVYEFNLIPKRDELAPLQASSGSE